jgi:aminoglycoside 6'-N-acetyltransferase
MAAEALAFTRLTRGDFPLISDWLRDPVVQRWWADDPSLPALEEHFGASIDGKEPTEVFIAYESNRPFALIQRYRIDSYAEYQVELEPVLHVAPGTWSFDYLIGSPEFRGRGLGVALLTQFRNKTFRDYPEATTVLIPVHAENQASWRALERSGFVRVAAGEITPDNPIDSRSHFFYEYEREHPRNYDEPRELS